MPAPPEGHRVYAAGAQIGDEVFVFGGAPDFADLSKLTNGGWRLRSDGSLVARTAPMPVPSFGIGAAAAAGGRVYVFGGARWDAAAGEVRNLDVALAYDPKADRWEELPKLASANRGISAVALDERRIFLAGGRSGRGRAHRPAG